MKPKFPAIDLRDRYSLLAVWELNEGFWQLLDINRPKQAIALWSEKPCSRLVFPTAIKPNGIWGGTCRKPHSTKQHKRSSRHQHKGVIQPSKTSPAQTKQRTAVAASSRGLPPVKVDFVDPKILQGWQVIDWSYVAANYNAIPR